MRDEEVKVGLTVETRWGRETVVGKPAAGDGWWVTKNNLGGAGFRKASEMAHAPMTLGDHEDAHRGDATVYEDLPKSAAEAPLTQTHDGKVTTWATAPPVIRLSISRWGSEPVEYVLKSAHDSKVTRLEDELAALRKTGRAFKQTYPTTTRSHIVVDWPDGERTSYAQKPVLDTSEPDCDPTYRSLWAQLEKARADLLESEDTVERFRRAVGRQSRFISVLRKRLRTTEEQLRVREPVVRRVLAELHRANSETADARRQAEVHWGTVGDLTRENGRLRAECDGLADRLGVVFDHGRRMADWLHRPGSEYPDEAVDALRSLP